jgi:glycerophosphoryl diester phosphodiesterase
MAAFTRAIRDGADIIETDLHLTRDGVIVCIHDDTVDRTTNGSGAVAAMTHAELGRLRADYGREGFEAEKIPTLLELASALPEHVALALELKSDAFLEASAVESMIATLSQAGVRARTFALSFSMDRLQSVRRIAPDLAIGWITLSRALPRSGVELLGPFWPWLFLNPLYVWLAHRNGQLVCPLDPVPDRRLTFYRALGCDAVLSDDPGATYQALGRAADT